VTPLGSVLAGVGAVCALAALATRVDGALSRRLLALACSGAAAPPRRARLVVGTVGSTLIKRGWVDAERAQQVTRAAGWGIGVDTFVGAKALAAGVVAVGWALAVPLPSSLAGLVVAAAVYRAPDVVAARAARARTRRMEAELPQLLDLLAAASHAGLAGPAALHRAVRATRGPLCEELRRVVHAVELGARWRDELASCAERLALPELRRAVTALTRTEHLGSSLADSMTELATRVRDARHAATTERATKAPVKMLFPLVFLVLPAFLLLTVAPVLFSTLRSIH
jgi:tight adherence protein C